MLCPYPTENITFAVLAVGENTARMACSLAFDDLSATETTAQEFASWGWRGGA